jgi:CubicO group peptidase (beta-lactamase class C family)
MSLKDRAAARIFLPLFLCSCFLPALQAQDQKPVFPAANWERIAKPEDAGYSSAKLDALRVWLKTLDTKALFVSVGGRVLLDYGDSRYVSKIASARKSVLGMLYGKHVESGKIDLQKTVVELGLQDSKPFLPIEGNATLEMLLMSRSGIYQFTNEEGENQPPRNGSQYPGTFFCYQNWDFDAAGTAFEKLTGKNIYDALETDFARPLAMQDFDRVRQKKTPGPIHPEYAMYLSARDMARLGLLMLRGGDWNGTRILPVGWAKYLTTLVTPANAIYPFPFWALSNTGASRFGFGVTWWVWDQPHNPGDVWVGPFYGSYSANGSGGQYLTVLPTLDIVISHKVEIEGPSAGDVSFFDYMTLVQMLIGAHCGDHCSPKK